MAFSVPTFNLLCDIFTGPYSSRELRIVGQICNLQYGRRLAHFSDFPSENEGSQLMSLLLPKLTDVRSTLCGYEVDIVECPQHSGRIYWVSAVDDVGKGFDNEFRVATLVSASEAKFGTGSDFLGLFWPTPIP
jgi:hypothetical protein